MNPPIIVTHQAGLRFAAQVRQHQVLVDQTEKGAGEDSAPTPLELLGASLGSCIALYVHKFLQARGLPTQDVRVEVTPQTATNPSRIARFEARVVMGEGIPQVYRPILEAVARACPAHATLAQGAEIRVEVDYPVMVTARAS